MALAPLRPAPDLVSLVAFGLSLAGALLLATRQGGRRWGRWGGGPAPVSGRPRGAAGRAAGPGRGCGHPGRRWAMGAGRAQFYGRAGADRVCDHWGVVVDGVQGPGCRPGAAACARAGAWVAARWPGRAVAAGCRGRGPGHTGRGPGRGLGHLGVVARPAGRLPPPTADRLTARHSLPA